MFKSINPYTGQVIATFQESTIQKANEIINKTDLAFQNWRMVKLTDRSLLMSRLANILEKKKEKLGRLITLEMGKLIGESYAEIEKCAWLCKYYAENAEEMLKPEILPSDGSESYVRFDPTGVIYAIMPWNFPFWQVLRFAIPNIMAGNTVVLKHSPNVFGCAEAMEQLFIEAGFPLHVFSNLIIPTTISENVIENSKIQGVTITGSQKAGSVVAAQAGKYLKKSVLELGGSDPCIVFSDADFNTTCKIGTTSRMMNSGQVCISAKRFIVEQSIFDQFVEEQKVLLESLKPGDPLSPETNMAPLARKDLLDSIDKQVQKSVKMGAKLITGGHQIANTNFYSPTMLINVKKGMPVYDEETFGPVSIVIPFNDFEEAVSIANDTQYGLGASIWTKDIELADKMAAQIEAGAVFINGMTKSDPRLPFGGTKQSGYGRELSHFGIREFVNIKTVWIK